jgi:hypothetical protein
LYTSSGFIGFQIILNRAIIDVKSKQTTEKDVRINLSAFFYVFIVRRFLKKTSRVVYSIYKRFLCLTNSTESGLLELLNERFLFIKIWLIERFDPKPKNEAGARGNIRSNKFRNVKDKEKKEYAFEYYEYYPDEDLLRAIVLGFIFMVPSVIKGVAVERQTGIKVDGKC